MRPAPAPVPLVSIRFYWGEGPGVRDAVLDATGDEGFADWAAERYPRGGFGLYAAGEAYRTHLQTEELLTDGISLTLADVRTILGRMVKEAGECAASPEPVISGLAPRFWEIAAKLKRVTESTPAGTMFRLAVDRATAAASQDGKPEGEPA